MSESLQAIDTHIFYFLNTSATHPALDVVMPFLTDLNKQLFVKIFLVFFYALVFWRGSNHLKIAMLLLIPAIFFSDQLSNIVKHYFERPRPCKIFADIHLLVPCGGGYSMPSSHAVNNFAGAVILSFFYSKYKKYFFVFAGIIAYSRVYVGVHYVSDLLIGAMIGIMCGNIILAAWNKYFKPKFFPQWKIHSSVQ